MAPGHHSSQTGRKDLPEEFRRPRPDNLSAGHRKIPRRHATCLGFRLASIRNVSGWAMRSTMGKRTLAAIALLGLLGSASRAQALTAEVRDEAGFFKPEAVTRTNEVIKEIEQRSRKD